MCRRCGEPDKRGPARARRRRRQWLADTFGDGTLVPCTWCGLTLSIFTLQVDRLVPGGSYARDNVVPSCAGCNLARTRNPIPEGCSYG